MSPPPDDPVITGFVDEPDVIGSVVVVVVAVVVVPFVSLAPVVGPVVVPPVAEAEAEPSVALPSLAPEVDAAAVVVTASVVTAVAPVVIVAEPDALVLVSSPQATSPNEQVNAKLKMLRVVIYRRLPDPVGQAITARGPLRRSGSRLSQWDEVCNPPLAR